MVRAYHAIWAAYGFWLPNDPRGSWSTEVWAPHLRRFGEATKTTDRRSLANRTHDANARREAKRHLRYPPVRLNGTQGRAVGRGFASIIPVIGLKVHGFAVMPDHVHMVIERHPSLLIEEIVAFLKRAATRSLTREGIHPLQNCQRQSGRVPSPWVEDGWFRYLNDSEAIEDAISNVEQNPPKIGLPVQRWRFVVPYSHTSRWA